jgi:hypothetical protein
MSQTPPPTLEGFFERVRTANPFLVNRVDRPWAADLIDVADIHDAEFRTILALGHQAQQEDRGLGVVVWGEAGVGKSHLLARLARWAGLPQQGLFVYLHNLQASPERLPRYVLRCILSVLTAARTTQLYQTHLFLLVNDALKEALRAAGLSRGTWPLIAAAYRRVVDRLAARDPSHGVLFERTVYDVLYRFFQAAYPAQQGKGDQVANLAVRWLSGEALDPAEARLLGLQPAGGPTAPFDNQRVKQILVALAQLARLSGRLFLVCFDQVDNLDEAQIKALSRFLHDLLDSAGNLLVVTTGVRETMLGFLQRGVITETSWDRLGQVEIPLGRLRPPRARELLAARLGPILAPFAGLKEVKKQMREDALFPLGGAWLDRRLGHLFDFRPRDLLTWAGERWRQQQERLRTVPGRQWLEHWRERVEPAPEPGPVDAGDLTASIDQKIARKLTEETERRRREPTRLPPSEDQMLGLTLRLLKHHREVTGPRAALVIEPVVQPTSGSRLPYDLVLRRRFAGNSQDARLGVRFLVAGHGNTVTAALRALADDADPPERVVLVTDEREPLPLGPEGTRRLEQLRQRGAAFRHLELTYADYAALDALVAVVDDARSGDLDLEMPSGQAHLVSEQDVIDSYHRHDRFRAHPLLRELLGEAAAPSPSPTKPAGKDLLAGVPDTAIREFLVAQAALEDGVALTTVAERYAGRLAAGGEEVVDVAGCLARLRQVAARMAGDHLLLLTSDGQRLHLPGRKR